MTVPDYFRAEAFDPVAPASWDDRGLRSHQRIAARFASYAAGKALYVNGSGWHYWDGARWAADDRDARTNQLLTELLKISWQEAISDQALAADVKASMTATGSAGVLSLASRKLFAANMDTDPWKLNCANGTLDLHTLQLRPHDPADNITKVTTAAYDPHADSETFRTFLESSLPDESVRKFLQRYAGLSLIGRVLEHVLVIATGSGRNGKGVLARAISTALGDYAITASNSMLIASRYGQKSAGEQASQMRLRGARWAVMSELEKGDKLAESTMKSLTGGDTIEAKYMGQNPVEFAPSHSFFMLTNDLPSVDADATAVWDRMRVVPFDVSFAGREDVTLEERLEADIDAVLAWAIAGLRAYQSEGLAAPAAVMAKTGAYREENDPLALFMADECVRHPHASVGTTEFAHSYSRWALENGEAPMSPRAIGMHMKQLQGITQTNSGGRKWAGIGFRADD